MKGKICTVTRIIITTKKSVPLANCAITAKKAPKLCLQCFATAPEGSPLTKYRNLCRFPREEAKKRSSTPNMICLK